MSSIRLTAIRTIILFAFLLNTGKTYCQLKSGDSLLIQDTQIDTTDYIPFFYAGALDYNLMIASSNGYNTEIDRLISKGADVNAETEEGATPLIFAVSNNRIEAVKTLLQYEPTIDKPTNNIETPLLIAVKNRYFEVAEALIRAGADVNFRSRYDATPLHFASLNGYADIADLLLYYDAAIDMKSTDGTTPLLAAIRAGNTGVADLLIQKGADPEEKDNDGFTPFLLASFYADTLVMDILYKKGADIYAINNAHNNALSLTISTGQTYAIDYLLRTGNKWANPGNDAVDPYNIAAKYNRPEIIKILQKNNIPGHVSYKFDQLAISLSTRFLIHDIYTGISLSIKEPYLNAGFIVGCDIKLWYTKVLIRHSENLFYQYMDKGSVAYAGVFKDFALTNWPGKFNYSLSGSLLAGYSFGNKLRGTLVGTDNKFKVIPAISFKITKMNLSLNLGIEYMKTEFYHSGPLWLRLGVSYNYYFDNLRTVVRPIRWY